MKIMTGVLASAAFSAAFMASAQDEITVKTDDLGGGVYAVSTGVAGNVGVLVGDDGVFIIDTQMANLAPKIDEAIKAVSGGDDVDLVLNTHLHGDHVLGNGYFAAKGAVIMAHPNVRPGLISPKTSQLSGRTPDPLEGGMLPTVSVNEGDAVTMNGQTAELYHTPNAHTDGDIFVYFKEANVLHAGDLLFNGWFPYIDLDNGGTVDGYIAGMQRIVDVADDKTVIIAGHGPLGSEADLEASIAMLKAGKAAVQALVDQGMTLAEVQKAAPLAAYHDEWNWGFITTERMVWTLYRDITGKTE